MGVLVYALLFIMPVLQILSLFISVLYPDYSLQIFTGLVVSHLFQFKGAKWVVQLGTGFSLYRIKNKRLYWFLGLVVILLFAFLVSTIGVRENVFQLSFWLLLGTLASVFLSTNMKIPQFLYLNDTAVGFFLKLGQIEYVELKEMEINSDELKIITPFDQIDIVISKKDFYNEKSFDAFIKELQERRSLHLERIKN